MVKFFKQLLPITVAFSLVFMACQKENLNKDNSTAGTGPSNGSANISANKMLAANTGNQDYSIPLPVFISDLKRWNNYNTTGSMFDFIDIPFKGIEEVANNAQQQGFTPDYIRCYNVIDSTGKKTMHYMAVRAGDPNLFAGGQIPSDISTSLMMCDEADPNPR